MHRLSQIGVLALLTLVAVSACEERVATVPLTKRVGQPTREILAPVDSDPVMGSLSAVARHVAAALQDSAVRVAVATEMRAPTASFIGLDLQACQEGGIARALLASGERRGAGSADALCATVSARKGLVLYMDRDRLRAWNPTVVPIVTAIDNPEIPLPPMWHGYRSPTRTIELSRNGSLKGPILVVLPYRHPRRNPGPMPQIKTATKVAVPGQPLGGSRQ